MRLRALVFSFGLFAVWSVPFAFAADVAGTVYGSDRSRLEDVEVGLISLSTGQTLLTHTDIAGQYGFTDLASGEYSLYFEVAEYAVQRIGPFELLPGSPREWEV